MSQQKFVDLMQQTYDFPSKGFDIKKNNTLTFHGLDLMKLVKKYGSPLKITYLPRVQQQIEQAQEYFAKAMHKQKYHGKYFYTYCTKSSHFSFIINKAIASGAQLEISSAYDILLIRKLFTDKKITKDIMIICNGYKSDLYLENIVNLWKDGFKNIIVVLDNEKELGNLEKFIDTGVIKIGIRIATEEEPKAELYTSRLGMSAKEVVKFYKSQIKKKKKFQLVMVHFFINSKIKDSAYYWSELSRLSEVYCDLSYECKDLIYLDIGGGFPINTALDMEYDYEYMIDQIVWTIQHICDANDVKTPHIVSEFGSYTVGESGAIIYKIIWTKRQNEKETRYMINSSFITTLPDTWWIGQKFIMLPLNLWNKWYMHVNLGGITCDSEDYYNKDNKDDQIILPVYGEKDELYVWFFHTWAYQESIGGYWGIQHCLIPAPQHIIIDEVDGKQVITEFAPEQDAEQMLNILGY